MKKGCLAQQLIVDGVFDVPIAVHQLGVAALEDRLELLLHLLPPDLVFKCFGLFTRSYSLFVRDHHYKRLIEDLGAKWRILAMGPQTNILWLFNIPSGSIWMGLLTFVGVVSLTVSIFKSGLIWCSVICHSCFILGPDPVLLASLLAALWNSREIILNSFARIDRSFVLFVFGFGCSPLGRIFIRDFTFFVWFSV